MARRAAALVFLLASQLAQPQVFLSQGTNIAAQVSPTGERIAMDLLGSLWVLPATGGQAAIAGDSLLPVRFPRWAPDGQAILYQASSPAGTTLWLLRLDTQEIRSLSTTVFSDQQGSWHPDGTRIVFSSERHGRGLDLWEMDLQTGLSWRLTHHPGDETEAAWSANGRHLVYVRRFQGQWSLMLRRHGAPDEELLYSDTPLSSPAWRPDGSLITFLRHQRDRYLMRMVILADPPLEMPLADGEDFFLAPASWIDRHNFIYTADGMIKSRAFDSREARQLHFRAPVGRAGDRQARAVRRPALPLRDPPESKFIVRSGRVFDGWRYREGVDILVDGPRIVAVGHDLRDTDAVVLELGNVTILPGYIDIYASIPDGDLATLGARLLAYGVTTLVSDADSLPAEAALWDSEATPGPRLLRAADMGQAAADIDAVLVTVGSGGAANAGQRDAVRKLQSRGIPVLARNWALGLGLGADLLLGADTLPSSPGGKRYQDLLLATGSGPLTLVSGLADAGTPGLTQLFNSRQAQELGHRSPGKRRIAGAPRLFGQDSTIVAGSKPNGLPAGLALHAEILALGAAGLPGIQVMQAVGRAPATTLGLQDELGTVTPGALADLVMVTGDPLEAPQTASNIVGVMRNGRFFSLSGLLERATGR
ncbi:MAG: PD40 domain-containing protein [Gammaproteobacteria bacterium]|nr:PD40 domain-containing protein [Gammaproteobacteria bacterium]